MRGRPLTIDWNPEDTLAALHGAYRAAEDPLVKPRLQALWLLRSGQSMVAVADAVGFAYRSVQRWVERYRVAGRARLEWVPPPPTPPTNMTPAQWDAVRAHLRSGTTKTIAQIQQWIATQWGIPWSYEGLRQALDRERITLKVPRPRHDKTDRARQEAWKKGGSRPRSRRR